MMRSLLAQRRAVTLLALVGLVTLAGLSVDKFASVLKCEARFNLNASRRPNLESTKA